jgi:hypothetical protein
MKTSYYLKKFLCNLVDSAEAKAKDKIEDITDDIEERTGHVLNVFLVNLVFLLF